MNIVTKIDTVATAPVVHNLPMQSCINIIGVPYWHTSIFQGIGLKLS